MYRRMYALDLIALGGNVHANVRISDCAGGGMYMRMYAWVERELREFVSPEYTGECTHWSLVNCESLR